MIRPALALACIAAPLPASALSPWLAEWRCEMAAGTEGLDDVVWLRSSGAEVWAVSALDHSIRVDWELRTYEESGMTFGAPGGPGHTLTFAPGPDLWETHIGDTPVLVATCEDL